MSRKTSFEEQPTTKRLMTLKLSGMELWATPILQGGMPSDHEFWSEKSGGTWEPREEHKGNIARPFSTSTPCTLVKEAKSQDLSTLETLYQWHLDDPVDAEELDRNDKVESQQGNRNPYVDYPDFVWDAWFQDGAIGCPTDVNNDGFTNVEDVLSVLKASLAVQIAARSM